MTPEDNYGKTVERAEVGKLKPSLFFYVYLAVRICTLVFMVAALAFQLIDWLQQPSEAFAGLGRFDGSVLIFAFVGAAFLLFAFLTSMRWKLIDWFAQPGEGLGRFHGSMLIFSFLAAAFLLFAAVTSMRWK